MHNKNLTDIAITAFVFVVLMAFMKYLLAGSPFILKVFAIILFLIFTIPFLLSSVNRAQSREIKDSWEKDSIKHNNHEPE